jgi:hypothetical protein
LAERGGFELPVSQWVLAVPNGFGTLRALEGLLILRALGFRMKLAGGNKLQRGDRSINGRMSFGSRWDETLKKRPKA